MAKLERTVERRTYHVPPLKRASWGAIFGGAFIALAAMVLLGALGVAVGASTIDPAEDGSPSVSALGLGAAIWWLISGILALFAGGWVAGRLSGLRRRAEGTLHGLVTWGLYTAVAMVVTTSVVGALVSGGMRVIGAGASVAAAGAQGVVSGVAGDVRAPDVAWQKVWNEAQQILRQTQTPALQPEELEGAAREAAGELQNADVEAALSTLYRQARTSVNAADKDAVVNVLVARTDMSREEAQRTVDEWASTFQAAWQNIGAAGAEAESMVKEAADTTADAVAAAAWWSFFYLLLTAAAAGLGGMLGSPRTDAPLAPSVVTTEEETRVPVV